MNGSFSAQAVRLGEMLSGDRVYAMPGFQRPYCWTTVEAGRVLDDILFAVDDLDRRPDKNRVFFLGTIVLIETSNETSANHGGPRRQQFDIVDGQQRFITLTMLIAVLRDLARADGDFHLAERLDLMIAFPPEDIGAARTYRVSMRDKDEQVLVRHAKQKDACRAEADPEEFEGAQRDLILNRNYLYDELRGLDKSLWPKLANFLEQNCQVVVISTDDTDNAFRIFMVVNQQGKPLSRNDLLKAELIGSVPENERNVYVARWEAAERGCGTQFEQLFSHIRTALGNGRSPIINEIRGLVQREGGGKAFLDRYLLPFAYVHAAMLGRAGRQPILNAPALKHVRILDRLSHSDWVPPALLWIFERQNDPDEIAAFLAVLDRTAYGHLLLGLGRDKRSARYAAVIDAIRAGQVPHADRGPLSMSAEDQRNILFNATNNLYGRSTIACKLLLLRLNDAMGDGFAPEDPGKITIEHILPQRVARNSRWRELFSDAERTAFAGSLGNLVLVSPEMNKAARNFDFDKKLELYRQDPHMRRLPINRDVLEVATFGPTQIQERADRLIETMRTLWNLSPTTSRRLAS